MRDGERENVGVGHLFLADTQSLTLSQGETSWRVRRERSSCVQSVHRYVHVLTAKPSVLSASQRLQILFISFISLLLLSSANAGEQLFFLLPSRRPKDKLPILLQ